MRKWYSLRKYSLIPLSKTNVDQNLKGGETRKAITSEGIRLMAISSSCVIASAPARLPTPLFSGQSQDYICPDELLSICTEDEHRVRGRPQLIQFLMATLAFVPFSEGHGRASWISSIWFPLLFILSIKPDEKEATTVSVCFML